MLGRVDIITSTNNEIALVKLLNAVDACFAICNVCVDTGLIRWMHGTGCRDFWKFTSVPAAVDIIKLNAPWREGCANLRLLLCQQNAALWNFKNSDAVVVLSLTTIATIKEDYHRAAISVRD